MKRLALLIAVALAAGLGGCNSSSSPPVVQAPPAPPDPATLGVSGGVLGSKLTEADRRTAGEAQLAAAEAGERKSWRGKQGTFGFVEPGPEGSRAEGTCREYTHTIYIDGRPQSGKGLACRGPAGTWRIVS